MPSKRKQVNVRVDEAQEELIPLLCDAIGKAHGLSVSVSDLFRMGMNELAKKYVPSPRPKKKGDG